MKCPQCGYEWKAPRKPSMMGQVMGTLEPMEVAARPRSEAKEAREPLLEKLQRPHGSLKIAAALDEEEIVGLAWLLCWLDRGVVTWAI